MKIKIAITDDEQLFRKGIRVLLEREKKFEILLEATNGQELIDTIDPKNLPDIVLLDIQMPILNGVETTKILRKKYPSIKIITLTSETGSEFISNMIHLGVSSYLLKNTNLKNVLDTIDEVFAKDFHQNKTRLEKMNKSTLPSKQKNDTSTLDKSLLSGREQEILALIGAQFTTEEIANKLYISPRTVDGHRNRLLLKTASKNMAGLIIYGIQKQLITV